MIVAASLFFALSIVLFVLWTRKKAEVFVLKAELELHQKIAAERELQNQNMKSELEKSFQGLAAQALHQQSETFLKIASERLDRKTSEAKGVFDEKALAIQKLVEPIEKTLLQVQTNLTDFERRRVEQFGQLSEQIRTVVTSSEVLKKETQILSTALKRPEVRGSWGEIQLRRVMEISGMSNHCDFSEQITVASDRGALRPDVVVHLPNQRILVIDSKVVLNGFVEYLEATTDEAKASARLRHVGHLKAKVKELSQKSYWDQFQESPEFAILFIPNEAALQAALEVDPELLENGWSSKVVIATPTTLIALMKAVAYGWQQQEVTENAKKVFESTQDLLDRMSTWVEHLRRTGSRLSDSVSSYNQAIGSLESRVLPSLKKIQQIGFASRDELPELLPVETQVRELKSESTDL